MPYNGYRLHRNRFLTAEACFQLVRMANRLISDRWPLREKITAGAAVQDPADPIDPFSLIFYRPLLRDVGLRDVWHVASPLN